LMNGCGKNSNNNKKKFAFNLKIVYIVS